MQYTSLPWIEKEVGLMIYAKEHHAQQDGNQLCKSAIEIEQAEEKLHLFPPPPGSGLGYD